MSCYTPPLPAGYYDVFVYLDGELLARNPSSTTFLSHAYYTPIISGITPTLAVSQKLITLTGDFKVNSFSQETENIWGDATPRVSRFEYKYPFLQDLDVLSLILIEFILVLLHVI